MCVNPPNSQLIIDYNELMSTTSVTIECTREELFHGTQEDRFKGQALCVARLGPARARQKERQKHVDSVVVQDKLCFGRVDLAASFVAQLICDKIENTGSD
jgi:hypothetical protein